MVVIWGVPSCNIDKMNLKEMRIIQKRERGAWVMSRAGMIEKIKKMPGGIKKAGARPAVRRPAVPVHQPFSPMGEQGRLSAVPMPVVLFPGDRERDMALLAVRAGEVHTPAGEMHPAGDCG